MRYVVYWLGIGAFGAVLVGGLWLIAPATLGVVVTSFAVMIGFAGWHCAKHGPTLRGFFALGRPVWRSRNRPTRH